MRVELCIESEGVETTVAIETNAGWSGRDVVNTAVQAFDHLSKFPVSLPHDA